MRIIIVTNKPLNTPTSGYDLRVLPLCQALAAIGHRLQLCVIPINLQVARDCSVTSEIDGAMFESIEQVRMLPSSKQSIFRHLRLDESKYYRRADPVFHRAACSQLSAMCKRFKPERVIYFGSNLSGFRSNVTVAPHLIDVCDSVHLTLDRQYAISQAGSKRETLRRKLQMLRWRNAEGGLSRHFQRIAAISPADASHLSILNNGAPVQVIPNGVNDTFLRSELAPPTPKRGVVFWGNLGFLPNADAMHFFYEEVHRPYLAPMGIEFAVIGASPPEWLVARSKQDNSLRLMGFVSDLTEVATAYPIMVAPLISGSGLKNKVLEAFALGLVVVATPMAVEAIPEAIEGIHYIGGSSPDQLAYAIKNLLDDPTARARLAVAAQSLVREHYRWESVGRKWCEWVEKE